MTPEEAAIYWQGQALKRVGIARINAVFEVRFAFGTEGGNFRASFNDVQTAPIAFPPSADQFKAALEELASVGVGGAKVRGVLRGPYEVEFQGANAGQAVPPLLIDGTTLTPAQEVIAPRLQQGDAGDYEEEVAQFWANHADTDDLELRMLQCAYDLVQLRLGKLADEYDVQGGQVNSVLERRNQRFANMRDREGAISRAISEKTQNLNAGARRPHYAGQVAGTSNGEAFGVLRLNPLTGRPE